MADSDLIAPLASELPKLSAADQLKLTQEYFTKKLPEYGRLGDADKQRLVNETISKYGGGIPKAAVPKPGPPALPAAPTPTAPPSATADINRLPMKDQFTIKYHLERGAPDLLRDYLTKQGYQIAGTAPGGFLFRDKKGNTFNTDDFAVAPALTEAAPAIGQMAGATGGLLATGGLGGEVGGAGLGQAAGELGRQAVMRHYGLGQMDLPTAGLNLGIGAAAQGLFSGGLPALGRSLSGLSLAERAAEERGAQIEGQVGAAEAGQASGLLKAGLDVGKLSEQLAAKQSSVMAGEAAKTEELVQKATTAAGEKKFGVGEQIASAKDANQALADEAKQAAEKRVGEQQATEELHGALGAQPGEALGRRTQLITEDQPWPAESYFTGLNRLQDRQGKLFEDVLKPIKNDRLAMNLEPTVQEIESRAYMKNLSKKTRDLLNEAAGRTGGEAMDTAQGAQPIRTIEELMDMRSRLVAHARARATSPTDKAAVLEVADAVNEELFNAPGLKSPESQAALKLARVQYARFKNVFTPQLTAKVIGARDPVEVANVIFGAKGTSQSPKVALNLIDALKDDAQAMTQLRDNYVDKVLLAPGGLKESRVSLAIHNNNGVLQKLFPDTAYANLKAWLDTPTYQQFAQRAMQNPAKQAAFDADWQAALSTPKGRELKDNLARLQELYAQMPQPEAVGAGVRAERQAGLGQAVQEGTATEQAKLAQAQQRQAGMPTPEQVGRVERRFQQVETPPEKAGATALYESARGGHQGVFGGRGMGAYLRHRAVFEMLSGYIFHNPAIILATGGDAAYNGLWSLAMRSPESAAAYYKWVKRLANAGIPVGKAKINIAHGLLDLMASIVTHELQAEPPPMPQSTATPGATP